MKLAGADGAILWTKTLDGPNHLDDRAWAIAAGPDGHPVVTGITTNADGSADFITAKLSSADGSVLWSRGIPGAIGNLDERTGWLVVCDNGDLVMGGHVWEPATSYDVLLIRFAAATGSTVWTHTYGSDGAVSDDPRALARDRAGSLLVAGVRSGDFMALKIRPSDGQLLWSATWNGAGNGYDTADAVLETASGEVVAAGFATGQGTSWDAAVIGLDPADGTLLWSTAWDGGVQGADEAKYTCATPLGDLYLAGYGYGFDSDSDILCVRYDLGTPVEVAGPQGNGPDGLRIAVDGPNPIGPAAQLALTLDSADQVRLGVFDASGRLLRSLWNGPLPAGIHRFAWRCESVPAGIYWARAERVGAGPPGATSCRLVRTR